MQPSQTTLPAGFRLKDERVWVRFETLVSEYKVSEDAIIKGTQRNRKEVCSSWENQADERDGRMKWIAMDSIPSGTKVKYNLPSLADLEISLKQRETEELHKLLSRVRPFLDDAERAAIYGQSIKRDHHDIQQQEIISRTVSHLPESEQQAIAETARWIKLMISPLYATRAQRKLVSMAIESKEDFYLSCVQGYTAKGGNLIPTSLRKLQDKLAAYKAEGIASLVRKKFGNLNVAKLGEMQKAWILDKACNNRKPTAKAIHELYVQKANRSMWQVVSPGTIKNYLNQPEVMPYWYYAQHGFEAWKNRYEYTMLTKAPIFREALWCIDGTKVNLFYQEGGKPKAKLQCTVVIDVFSEKIIGYAFSESESSADVAVAMRMAIANSGGQLPMQVLYDGDAANRKFFEQSYQGFGMQAMPYNGQSKPIENLFRRLQQQVMAAAPNFTGQNITARTQRNRLNKDALPEVKDLPTKQECLQQAALQFHTWNNLTTGFKNATRKELYANSVNPEPRFMLLEEEVAMFWETREKPVAYRKDGITVQINGERLHYEVLNSIGKPDLDFHMRYVGQPFYIKLDPCNASRGAALYIRAEYDKANSPLRFIAMATDKEAIPRALVDHTSETASSIAARLATKKNQKAATDEVINNLQENANDDGEDTLTLGVGFFNKNTLDNAQGDYLVAHGYNHVAASVSNRGQGSPRGKPPKPSASEEQTRMLAQLEKRKAIAEMAYSN